MPDILASVQFLYGKDYFEHEPCRTGEWQSDYNRLLNDPPVRMRFARLREEKLTSGFELLDIGCGRGLFLAIARELGWNPHGFDVTDANRTQIDEDCGIRIEVGTNPVEKFGEGVFDAVYCDQVLEHTSDPVRFMESIWTLLKPGGVLYLSFPNENALMHIYERTVKRLLRRPPISQQPLQPPYHILGFTQQAVDQLVKTGVWEVRSARKRWGADIFQRANYREPSSLRGRLHDSVFHFMAVLGDRLDKGRYFQVVLRKPCDYRDV